MASMTTQQALSLAAQHHQAGRLQQAESIYRQILGAQPDNPDALHLLGLVAFQVGRLDLAHELIRRAVAIGPSSADYLYNFGQVLAAMGRAAQSVASYRQALALRPDHAQAWNNLGNMLHTLGDNEQAVTALRQALTIQPNYGQASYNLGIVLHVLGRGDEAADAYRQAIASEPNLAEAWNNLGNVLREKSQTAQAIAAYRKTCEIQPNHPEAHSNLGTCLQEIDQLDDAMAELQRAIALQPDSAAAHYNFGNLLRAMDRHQEAIASFRRASALKPDFSDAHNAIGYSLRDQGQIPQAIAEYRQALELDPNNARAHHNLAMALLVAGQFEEGWQEAEWRFEANEPEALPLKLPEPFWDGSELNGRTILLHVEQGFGDMIQFCRYVELVARRRGTGGRIIFQCHPELLRLFKNVAGADEVVARDPGRMPTFDVQIPMQSLPRVLGTTLETIPSKVPYLFAEPELSAQWRARIPRDGVNVGLVWAGRPLHPADRKRSIPLETLAPLGGVAGARFFSLQKGEAANALKASPRGLDVFDLGESISDFADTAAIIDNLDLLIAVDTSVAHLAGALGKPVWTMIPSAPDWRWMLGRDDSPWYPTMRLFRQQKAGDWDNVVARIVDALRDPGSSRGSRKDVS